MTVDPGARRDLAPPASESYTGDRTTLPMAVLNGVADGPRVFVTAAVHGDELNGIATCRRLLDHVDPATLRGLLVVVPIVNVLGAQLNSRYLPDRRDLNRSFPGSRSGSMAARIARLLIDEVIAGSDIGIDLHTAASHRTNHPQVRLDTTDAVALDAAVAFGAPFVLDAKLRPGSLRAAAGDLGVPVLIYEGGGPSRFDPDPIDVAERGILRVLHRLGMIDQAPAPAHGHPMVLHESRWLRAERGGILELHVRPGERVEAGQPLWDTVSPLGEERAVREAAEEGYVIGATTLPLVQPGQAIVHLALPGDRVPSEDDPTEELEDDEDDEDGPLPA
ncbi:succinylglutamate desuccinylase/aspartoacylase family protein [Nitriliruptor alkaliphilus]|uniref:succinylglutamate desuccinylase/aspartoacylase family protein n=1 Tax=Nitriliruptor alkaliphilus TaxID=427918 RepID=UPI0012EE3C45|nr:M14 family metallopeptidase [Nitriliruptor alkaliphilus]